MKYKELKSIFKTIAIFCTLVFIFIIAYSFLKISSIIASLPNLDISKIYVQESTKIYDQNNQLLVELGVEKRDIVKYEDISPDMIHALTAIEDARFFEHGGIDYKRIVGALYDNIKSSSYKEGASTLTQQLVKLSYLSSEKTLNRKITEIFLSVELESRLPKEEIIEAYLNRVLFGGRIYGIEKASKHYFSKHANELNYEEAAVLAGMVQSPNRFNPIKNPEPTKERQMVVLQKMYTHGFITEDELNIALKRPLADLIKVPKVSDEYEKYYEYIDQVIYEIENKYNLDPLTQSLRVYTYLDQDIQDYIHEKENDESFHPNEMTQSGIVVLETETGIIRGIGGGRGYSGSMSFNFATDAKRQPGSTIKPLLDYGPAIEYLNYSTGEPFLDDKTYYSTLGSRFVPIENYDKKYKGYVTMREAIIDSRNVTAVKAFRQVGPDKAYEFINKLGLNTTEQKTEAHAIGGYQYGYSVLQLAGAYAPFGNSGYYIEPTTINYIIKNDKKIQLPREKQIAMKPETAYLMTDILHDNMTSGTAMRANVPNLIIAGKTGQTNYNYETRKKYDFPSDSVRDSWFIGYSTKYTTAVWLGYDKIDNKSYLTPNEAKKSLDLFRNIMDFIHKDKEESKPFSRPDTIIEVEIETNQTPVKLPCEYTPSMYRSKELFIKGTEPQEESTRFRPLDTPKNFIVYYDYTQEKLVLQWERYSFDFSANDYKLMESIHKIQNNYAKLKDNTLREYYKNNSPSFLSDEHVKYIHQLYCSTENTNKKICPFEKSSQFNASIEFLDLLMDFEITQLIKEKDIQILSEGELSELRGYPVWNGFKGGLFSNLGNIEYTIIGKKGEQIVELYKGPYANDVKIFMTLDDFIEYDSFSITADYSKYSYKLRSKPNVSLNPFFSLY